MCRSGLHRAPAATHRTNGRARVGPNSDPGTDEGSTIPLILGFWMVAMVMVAGAVALGDAFTKQRDLQSICDGAALAAANSGDPASVHGGGLNGSDALPLARVTEAVTSYLSRGENRGVQADAVVDRDGVTVRVTCRRHVRITFGAVLGRPGGIDQITDADARSPVHPD
jgi:hypothetical protein